ncbi:MAG: beta-lactamase family protein [candidate division KSB1 bacterium]|nr:beta-lactamase family protein [candidate division KSB1 bacterium]MDZ7364848.1 beta-lactamase family protein [candidate division KSB1 bacterium]MDZ7402951.1 beta-lactamase family protein [candidate division KSB1 bacterium]
MKSFFRVLIVQFCIITIVFAQGLPVASPETVGLSSQRLKRLDAVLNEYVEKKQIAGAVALVVRKGKAAYFKSLGMQDVEAKTPMRNNTIFRIASMTKPVTSVAVMILYEEGRFMLNDPVSKYLPEFKDMMVLNPERATNGQTQADSLVPAKRPITIRHLLTHTSGLTYHWNDKLGGPYKKAGIAHGLGLHNETLAENMKRLAKQPLLFHPGDKYEYGLSVDVLGYLVEVVSGKSLDDFFKERIFAPLKMHDTHFFLPENKVSRLATAYQYSREKGLSKLPDVSAEGNLEFSPAYPYSGPQKFYSGGAGLCATISDYARFAQMLLNGGELEGVRILSRKSVELMTADFTAGLNPFMGFGLGFGIRRSLSEGGELGSIGTYGWSGFWNTRFIVDPKEQMFAIVMTQLYPYGAVDLIDKFAVMVYQSVSD